MEGLVRRKAQASPEAEITADPRSTEKQYQGVEYFHLAAHNTELWTDRAASMRMVHMAEGVCNHFAEVM